eukprot:6177304-Pleurochrysis_carterae.AAC.3
MRSRAIDARTCGFGFSVSVVAQDGAPYGGVQARALIRGRVESLEFRKLVLHHMYLGKPVYSLPPRLTSCAYVRDVRGYARACACSSVYVFCGLAPRGTPLPLRPLRA